MYKEINTENWNRKALFEFFKEFDDPFFNITANLDVTALYRFCKANQLSLFLSNLHCALETVHEIPEFKMRLLNGKPVIYEEINIGSTILHDDNTFSFCYFGRNPDIFEFNQKGKENIEAAKRTKKLDPRLNEQNSVHCSIIPWISFTAFKHAKNFTKSDTIPKIVFGKLTDDGGRKKMPLSVEVNHAMMDGFHVGQYFEKFQKRIDTLKV